MPESAALFSWAEIRAALVAADPDQKCEQVARLAPACFDPALEETPDFAGVPGRPESPLLVPPRQVAHRGLGTQAGRAALCHAVAHIEFNAINLALDACYRFRDLPIEYYRDWLSVAQDEARHFLMVRARLRELGSDYGALPAHNGLWEACEKTAYDPMVRMALVPRVLEARGLDVTPGMIERLREQHDGETIAVLDVILREEVRHVEIGTRWFRWLCAQRGLQSVPTFRALLAEHAVQIRPPINWPARQAGGFVADEIPPELLVD